MSEYRKSLLYCVLFCLTLAALAAYDLRSAYLKEEESARIRVANNSFLISQWVKGAFEAFDYVLRDIVSQVPVSELRYPHPDPLRQARVTAFIKAKVKTLPDYVTGVGLADARCIVTHAYNAPPRPSILGFDGGQREWCRVPQADPQLETYVSNMFLSNTGHLTITLNRRFHGDAPGFYGLVGIEIELDFFSKWLEQVSIGNHGSIAIADSRLNLLARKPGLPGMLGKTVNDPAVKAFIASGDSHKIIRASSPLDGEDRLYSLRKVEQLPFVIVVGEAASDWFAGWRQRVWSSMFVLLLLWGMAVFILRNHWALLRQRQELLQLANTDALTGIANRRNFILRAEQEFRRAQRHASGLAVLVLDIDHFKQINDTHGHATGDRAIIGFTKACLNALRDIDLLGRLGGDEFAILLTDTTLATARVAAERIRHAIETTEVLDDGGVPLTMTSSIGVAMIDTDITDIDAALAKADVALYQSKQQGRNRVEFAD